MLCRKVERWRYRAERNFTWESGIRVPGDHVFFDQQGRVRLIIESTGRMTVMRGYAWNGCSPKFCFLDLLIGTPDGAVYAPTGYPKAYYASMVHDALYQFLRTDSPITRAQADRCFLRLLAESEFFWLYVYWLAARIGGVFVWHGKSAARLWRGTCRVVSETGCIDTVQPHDVSR